MNVAELLDHLSMGSSVADAEIEGDLNGLSFESVTFMRVNLERAIIGNCDLSKAVFIACVAGSVDWRGDLKRDDIQ